jgi:2-phosphosulfolactate phosphatase
VGPATSAVIVDALRATTTLTVALQRGAARVVPAATADQARRLRDQIPGSLLCGERDGRKIEGFDLGNSPFEYPAATVMNRCLIFASTNGSVALLAASRARKRLLAAFVNVSSVVKSLEAEREVTIVCAGKLGRFALEDAACAGLLCQRLRERGAWLAGASAEAARALAPRNADEVCALVQGSAHGRYLRALGPEFARDVEFCAQLDVVDRTFEV